MKNIVLNEPLNLDYIPLESPKLTILDKNSLISKKPLYSYSISTDLIKDKETILKEIKNKFIELTEEKRENNEKYLSGLAVKSKGELIILNYDDMVKKAIIEDINYKNSFVKSACANIENSIPIFITYTLDSPYHLNRNKILDILSGKELEDRISYLHYTGYTKLKSYNKRLMKDKVFRKDKLNKLNRASITAMEPHKDWTPHQHQLTFINGKFFNEYIQAIIRNVQNSSLGRTEIVLLKEQLENVKKVYKCKLKYVTNKKGKVVLQYHIKGLPVYFTEFIVTNNNIEKSVSNYLTNYIETKHITPVDVNMSIKEAKKKKEHEKCVIEYDAFAYYIAHLKDIYEPKKEHGKYYKKIRRISYTQLLISRTVYKRIMTEKFVEYLKSIDEFKTKNMYFHITNMLQRNELKILKYIHIFGHCDKVNKKTGEMHLSPQYEKNNVNYYNVVYKDYDENIDCKMFDIYILNNDTNELELKHESKQIDLGKDKFIILEYKLKIDGSKMAVEVL